MSSLLLAASPSPTVFHQLRASSAGLLPAHVAAPALMPCTLPALSPREGTCTVLTSLAGDCILQEDLRSLKGTTVVFSLSIFISPHAHGVWSASSFLLLLEGPSNIGVLRPQDQGPGSEAFSPWAVTVTTWPASQRTQKELQHSVLGFTDQNSLSKK